MKTLIETCIRQGITLSACESLTGGLFMAELASVPGCSAVLKGGFVTYTNEMKTALAHVPASLLEQDGAVSAACARSMAENTRALSGSTYSISFTGNAGPSALEGKPAGLVFCAIASVQGTRIYQFLYEGMERNVLRQKVVEEMAGNLMCVIKENTFGEKDNNHQK